MSFKLLKPMKKLWAPFCIKRRSKSPSRETNFICISNRPLCARNYSNRAQIYWGPLTTNSASHLFWRLSFP